MFLLETIGLKGNQEATDWQDQPGSCPKGLQACRANRPPHEYVKVEKDISLDTASQQMLILMHNSQI